MLYTGVQVGIQGVLATELISGLQEWKTTGTRRPVCFLLDDMTVQPVDRAGIARRKQSRKREVARQGSNRLPRH